MIFNLASTASALVLLSATVVSAAPKNGQIAQITSASNWCMMMPPSPGGDIAQNEDRAIAFCTNPHPDAPGAKIFPAGFIQSANFAAGNGYVQITGKIDRTKYSLADSDQGGQYDIRAPVGSACANYNHYVNLIEPHSNTYCIRCCKEKKDCNTGKSTYGCAYVIPGDYSGGSTDPVTKPVVSSSAAATSSVVASPKPTVPVPSGSATASASAAATTVVPSPTTATVPTSTSVAATTTTAADVKPSSGASSQAQSLGLVGAAAAGALALLAL
ncbi:hypothetical protein EMPS_08544 [Entomortierella parvispora]|uniref:Uncharacterized protein n=1 Tax=Entomortierella parvispora TaxID=205924 RepID=A0A9P3HG83_9FUNG|nr:hypothetical protein EMPS_08544 [Entomortierella parvispora]